MDPRVSVTIFGHHGRRGVASPRDANHRRTLFVGGAVVESKLERIQFIFSIAGLPVFTVERTTSFFFGNGNIRRLSHAGTTLSLLAWQLFYKFPEHL